MIYRMRAECKADADKVADTYSIEFQRMKYVRRHDRPDVEATFHSDLILDDIRNLLRRVKDGHVMLQTVALVEDYTGERDYAL